MNEKVNREEGVSRGRDKYTDELEGKPKILCNPKKQKTKSAEGEHEASAASVHTCLDLFSEHPPWEMEEKRDDMQ